MTAGGPEAVAAARPLRRRPWLRIAVTVIVVLLAAAAVVATLGGRTASLRADDPDSRQRSGASALSTIAQRLGVTQHRETRVADAVGRLHPGDTLVVANPSALRTAEWQQLLAARPGNLVVLGQIGPAFSAAVDVDAAVVPAAPGGPVVLEPACADPDARLAGALELSGPVGYRVSGEAVTCYPVPGGGHAFAAFDHGPTRVQLLGGGQRNSALAKGGNASFALAQVGRTRSLVWLMARRSSEPAPSGAETPRLLPAGWRLGWVMTGAAFLVVALWRGRRLGPLMTERLPVKVRASETVEGHGQLYHRIGAREHAAAALRRAALGRLGRLFGNSDPQQLAALASQRSGRPPADTRAALLGPPPGTDDQLVQLKQTLDALEREVRRL